MTKRVHILSTVNASHVSKQGTTYTVRDVCGAVDDIVMNQVLYPAEQLAAGVATMEGRPAPAGHPRDARGRAISALNGDALLTSYIGAVVRNARHEGGRSLFDIVVNGAQAKAHPDGEALLARLDAAITGTNAEPIHVSTGLMLGTVAANGESRGKKYSQVANSIQYDHLAILLNERGAGTPADGVGMFLNADGTETPIDVVELAPGTEDRRRMDKLTTWVRRLLGNAGSDLSFDNIEDALCSSLPDGAWLREVFDKYAVWTDQSGALWQQDYTVSSDGSVAWSGTAVEMRRDVRYVPVMTNLQRDPMKDLILAALNTAGIAVTGKTDAQLLADFEALKAQPHVTALNSANSKIAEHEAAARAAAEAELNTLATGLAVNSSLTVDDLKRLGLGRLREIKAKAAPVAVGNAAAGNAGGDEFAAYDMNALIDAKGAASAH